MVAGGSGGGALSVDALKTNPFLLPAPLLALNPALYAAQLAQLQAAQLLLAKQSLESGGGASADRKRAAEDEALMRDLGSKAKYSRLSSTGPADDIEQSSGGPESPLDLSGGRSPGQAKATDMAAAAEAAQAAAFGALLPPNIISFLNQLKSCSPAGATADFTGLFGLSSLKSSDDTPLPAAGSAAASRSNPWQSQWMNRAADGNQISDVFKCVWCKESYNTLEALTRHMREAKHHHGLPAGPPYAAAASPLPNPVLGGGRSLVTPPARVSAPPSTSPVASAAITTPPKPSPPARDILKEQLPLPRKLVRGQDVWIGRADQQTRDILKCMGCGQSFRSLDLLTKHMQETQHYKKVISHDQLSSWKYQDNHHQGGGGGGAGGPKNHVNSVLSCKVCDKGFGSLKELSDHMVRANHFSSESNMGSKSGLLRSPIPSSAAASASALAKERKKALPVKKLLELERARQEVGGASGSKAAASAQEILESGKLFCERCEERIPLDLFISHIQHCVGKQHFGFLSGQVKQEQASSPSTSSSSPDTSKRGGGETGDTGGNNNASILGSLEQLVKGNFQPRAAAAPDRKIVSGRSSPPLVGQQMLPKPLTTNFNRFSIQSMVSAAEAEGSSESGEGTGSGGQQDSQPPSSPVQIRASSHTNSPRDQRRDESTDSPPPTSPPRPQPKAEQEPSHQMDGGPGSPLSATTTTSSVNGESSLASPPQAAATTLKATSPVNGTNGGAAERSQPSTTFRLPIIKPEVLDPAAETPSDKASINSSSSSNPLAALQMLCDTQKKMPKIPNSSSSKIAEGSRSNSHSPLSDPGAILAFSWACNQAVVAADQSSVIKCPFCETPFISKGAYRHHLSKMHFTKETAAAPPPVAIGGGPAGTVRATPSPQDTKDEEETSLQSKYHKYAQMARQLSCNQK
jgi:uncharacterized C2H2 Zn-finger protein